MLKIYIREKSRNMSQPPKEDILYIEAALYGV